MKEIKLTRGFVAIVDDADYARVIAAGRWSARVAPHTVYAQRSVRKSDGRRTTQLLHRFLLGLTDPKILVDHRDRHGLHNWRENLRVATKSQNGANQRRHSNGSSQYRGVSWNNRHHYWHALIEVSGRAIHLGCFIDELDAARAYDLAAFEHFGEFANLNFPPKKPPKKPTSNATPSDSLAVTA